MFQSAPLTEARGDSAVYDEWLEVLMFQSAPLTEARGDIVAETPQGVSNMFQSAPLTEARGDLKENSQLLQPLKGFNPLPSPKQGETNAQAD